jgi:CheY-like chemotaxis protein
MPPPLPGKPHQRILVVDDDVDIARFVEMELSMAGFDVAVAHDGAHGLELVAQTKPDLVIVDLIMPVLDGVEMTRRLRADAMTSALPIIMLTAKSQTAHKVLGLSEGADDYVVKPFETLELVARVRSILRRNQEFREVSPLTGLPGNNRILQEISSRLRLKTPFAVCYCDIDGFKSVNDAYGFARGDEFIVTLANKLRRAVAVVCDASGSHPPPHPPPFQSQPFQSQPFLGHVGGDDFVVICDPDLVVPLTTYAVDEFEAAADRLYDAEDLDRGYLMVRSRRDGRRDVGLVSVSIGVALSSRRRYTDPRELVADASEMKMVAKSQRGSYVAVDRRTGE